MEIVEGVWQLKIPMRFNPLGHTYSYLVDESTLIDTGVGSRLARSALDEQLGSVGLNTSDIERVVITHLHRDHIGLIGYVTSTSGSKICAHETAREVYRTRVVHGRDRHERIQKELRAFGGKSLLRVLSRIEPAFRHPPSPFAIDETVSDGDFLKLNDSNLRVIWTPGHAHEHICLYDNNRSILFTGDHVLPRITSHISLFTQEDADPLADYLNSLNKLKGLTVNLVMPAHEYAFRNLEDRLDALRLHHEARCREILDALLEGEKTVFQVSELVSWDAPWKLMQFWSKLMAASETFAHLAYLRNKGQIKEKFRKGVLHYCL